MSAYPSGGTPPQITTTTTTPSHPLPVTGGDVSGAFIGGFGAIVLGTVLLVAVAKARLPRFRRAR